MRELDRFRRLRFAEGVRSQATFMNDSSSPTWLLSDRVSLRFGRQTVGTLYEFKCPACGYSAEVSGGDDVGMQSVTTTIVCKTCKKLMDVVISEDPWAVTLDEPGLPLRPDFQPSIRCKKSARHKVERWTLPGPCPKCGTLMEQGEMVALWD